jgi:branched-chain amino acid transport system permease protein
MALIIDIIINGLISGSVYALLAIGFSLIFGVARIVNIAHTAFYMVAAYCIYVVTQKMGFHPTWGMAAAVVLVTLLGMVSYKVLINPIREHEGAVLIATIALAMALQEIMTLIFTGTYLSVPSLIGGYFVILGVKVFYQQLLTFCVALLVMAALWVLLMKTKLGLAIRSTAQDREVANLMGIDEARVAMMTMGVSVGLAAHDDGSRRIRGAGQPQGELLGGVHPGLFRSIGRLSGSHGRLPEGFGSPLYHDSGIAHTTGRSFWRVLRRRKMSPVRRTSSF